MPIQADLLYVIICTVHYWRPKLQSSSLLLSIFIKHLFLVVSFSDAKKRKAKKRIICPLHEVILGTFLQYWVLINFISYFISPYTQHHFIALYVLISTFSSPFVVKLYNFFGGDKILNHYCIGEFHFEARKKVCVSRWTRADEICEAYELALFLIKDIHWWEKLKIC